jgi:ferrochelatase
VTTSIDAVLLIGFGGPTAPHEIRPFLAGVARGRRIPPERLEEVARHYAAMPGGCSPLTELTRAQAEALEAALARAGRPLPVFMGMRNWHPYVADTLTTIAARGHRRVLGIILSAFRTEASWDRYMNDVAEARARVSGAPDVVFAPAWSGHPGFVDAAADRCQGALGEVPAAERRATPVVFTAHSVPVAMAAGTPYIADFTAAARAVAGRLGHERWRLAYQSRSGSLEEPWLEPDIVDVLRALAKEGARHVVVSPIGFVSDHVEVLYDLDVEARELSGTLGLAFHRAAALNDHPAFIAMLADLVAAA